MTRRLPRRLALALGVLLMLVLAACSSSGPTTSTSNTPKPTETVTSTPTASETPESPDVNSEIYLIEGNPGVFDSEGYWYGHYGFFTDDSQSVRCDIWIFSGDDPSTSCTVVPGNESKVTYGLPAGATAQCDFSTANPYDGYTLALGSKGLAPAVSGWSGCQNPEAFSPEVIAATTVLPDGKTLTVDPFDCTPTDGVAYCEFTDGSGSLNFGLDEATFN